MTKDEEKALQEDNKHFMYEDEKIDDIFASVIIAIVALVFLCSLFAWEVVTL